MSSRPSRGTARLAAILDALPDGLLLVNCNGTVVNANAIALEMFETPGTALVGRGLLDLLPEFDSKLIPGSMRRPEAADEQGRTKPTRMTARRTDGHEYPVEVTSASLDSGQAAYNDIHSSFTGDELLMLVVRDLSGTVDTEAELARSQRQTEMILRAASEGVVGTDTDGRVVLVNPAAAQILGFRASDLGGQELHPLILHSRAEGGPFPYEDSPLADTLKSGRKHRVRGQVLWSKSGAQVPVDLTTAPVRDGDQLVGAVMTFTDRRPYEELSTQHTGVVAELTTSHSAEVTALKEAHAAELEALKEAHAAELADRTERYAAEIEGQAEQLASVGAQHSQLTAVLGGSLRGPLEELRGELTTLASDPAGQLWPEANQILHHLAAGYARMTTLVDNVLGYQRLDAGVEGLHKAPAMVDGIVTGGIDGAVELIGPGRAQFAVHAPPIEAEVDAPRLATAIAHLVADVCGVDSTGKTRAVPGGGYVDSTVVVAAAQRGDVVRIEVRGPFAGGDPVHEPIVRGIVQAHGGVLQTHEMPGMSGSAYVLDLPIGTASGAIAPPETDGNALPPEPAPVASSSPEGLGAPGVTSGGRRRARRSSTDAFLDGPGGTPESIGDNAAGAVAPAPEDRPAAEPTGRRRARRGPAAPEEQQDPELIPAQQGEGSGRRRGRPSPAEAAPGTVPAADAVREQPQPSQRGALALTSAPSSAPAAPSEGSVVTAAENAQGGGRPQLGQTVPPQGVPVDPQQPVPPTGRRARREDEPALPALPALASGNSGNSGNSGTEGFGGHSGPEQSQQPGGRRARRALAAAQERTAAEAGPRTAFALPPADADRTPIAPDAPGPPATGRARTTRVPHRTPVTRLRRRTPSPRRTAARRRTEPPGRASRSRPERPTRPARTTAAYRRLPARRRTSRRGATRAGTPTPTPGRARTPAPGGPPTPPASRPSPIRWRTRPTVTRATRPRTRGGSRCPPRSRCRTAATPTRRRGGPSACERWARACRSPSTSRTSRTSRIRASAGPAGAASSPPRRRATAPRPGPPAAGRPRPSRTVRALPRPLPYRGRSRTRPIPRTRARTRLRLRSPVGRVSTPRAGPAPPTARGSCSRRPSRRGARTP